MKYEELHRLVRANGWVKIRQLGTSHIIYKKGTITYPVPYHGAKEVGKGLERKIRKDMKLI
jgi:predicted RNA binding protein YcfA (HicA-like mRNA interferase family)